MVKKTPITPLKKGRFNIDSVQDRIPEIDGGAPISLVDAVKPAAERMRKINEDARNRYLSELKAHAERLAKWDEEATNYVGFYWGQDPKNPCADLSAIQEFLTNHPINSAWQVIHLIEAAGNEALERGYRGHKSEIAKAKNRDPRIWVQNEWAKCENKKGNKTSFAKQHVELVKKKFGIRITHEQISRVWLKSA